MRGHRIRCCFRAVSGLFISRYIRILLYHKAGERGCLTPKKKSGVDGAASTQEERSQTENKVGDKKISLVEKKVY